MVLPENFFATVIVSALAGIFYHQVSKLIDKNCAGRGLQVQANQIADLLYDRRLLESFEVQENAREVSHSNFVIRKEMKLRMLLIDQAENMMMTSPISSIKPI